MPEQKSDSDWKEQKQVFDPITPEGRLIEMFLEGMRQLRDMLPGKPDAKKAKRKLP